MAQYRDYQASTVGQSGCTYSQLANTYMGRYAGMSAPPMSMYVVPKFCQGGSGPQYPPAYDTLTHGQKYNCGGYFAVTGAYPYATCNSCQQEFVDRPCKGNISDKCNGSSTVPVDITGKSAFASIKDFFMPTGY